LGIGSFENGLRSVEAVVVVCVAADVCDLIVGDSSGARVVGIVQVALDLMLVSA
jgi:hypothetical protein